MQIFSITSGKGGVGRTSLICNLALHFGQRGRRVLLIDADMGLANVDIVMGFEPEATIAALFEGRAALAELLVEARPNVFVLPAASGVQAMTRLRDAQMMQLVSALDGLEADFDLVLVDTGAGIGENVLRFNAAARRVLVVSTLEPASMMGAHATMKVLNAGYGLRRFALIVNRIDSRAQALEAYRRITRMADRDLDVALDYAGFVLRDPEVSRSAIEGQLLLERAPDSPAAACIRALADDLARGGDDGGSRGRMQFFWKRLLRPA